MPRTWVQRIYAHNAPVGSWGRPLTQVFFGMFIYRCFMYILMIYWRKEGPLMATTSKRSHKHFQLDSVKIKRAQKLLRADTQTEAIERALDLVIAEHEKSRLALAANDRFVKSGVEIKDIYGTLED